MRRGERGLTTLQTFPFSPTNSSSLPSPVIDGSLLKRTIISVT
jgi:hypothetical protein